MKTWITPRVHVRAWDRPWTDAVHVTTDFFHLIPDEDLDGIWALAQWDHSVITRIAGVNPDRCDPARRRDHERPRL